MTNACRIALVAVVSAVSAGGACAQSKPANYPAQPVKIIVPFPAGGRHPHERRRPAIGRAHGQQMPIHNIPGAGANIGAETAARSPADGHKPLHL